MSDDDVRYFGVIFEEIRDQNRAVLEAVGDMQRAVAALPEMKQDIAELKADMKVVKAAITDVSRQLADHELRITRLEAAQ